MKNFQNWLKTYKIVARENCSYSQEGSCVNPKGCVCNSIADIRATIKAVLPNGYDNYTIYDFDGTTKSGEKTVPDNLVIKAKEAIKYYCWGDKFTPDGLQRSDFNKRSLMNKRFCKGTNLVIHGKSYLKTIEEKGLVKTIGIQKAKTLLASVVITEAIWTKHTSDVSPKSFEWISYHPSLKDILSQKNTDEADYYERVHWLVVDDIEMPLKTWDSKLSSDIMATDLFFNERLESGLPSILVFQCDLDEVDIKSVFGKSIYKIVSSDNTCLIKL